MDLNKTPRHSLIKLENEEYQGLRIDLLPRFKHLVAYSPKQAHASKLLWLFFLVLDVLSPLQMALTVEWRGIIG